MKLIKQGLEDDVAGKRDGSRLLQIKGEDGLRDVRLVGKLAAVVVIQILNERAVLTLGIGHRNELGLSCQPEAGASVLGEGREIEGLD